MGKSRATTIVAPATAAGVAALAVVRLSGPTAFDIVRRLAGRKHFASRRPSLTEVLDADRIALDQVLVTCFPAPASATGEDVVEISCHGSPVIVRAIVQACLALGAVMAAPGEFTRRAFLNRKIDLTQAEAVEDLIRSETLFQARRAREQLQGQLSARLQPQRKALIEVAAHLETALEFVEDEVETHQRKAIVSTLRDVCRDLEQLLETFRAGRLVREGLRVVITGPTNAGKSSIFNYLLSSERAITSPLPGTTRDVLIESVEIEGVPVTLVDTAGWRGSKNPVEQAGIRRTEAEIEAADLILFVIDGARGAFPDVGPLKRRGPGVSIVTACNKSDLKLRLRLPAASDLKPVAVSAATGEGFDNLRQQIRAAVWPATGLEVEGAVLTRSRHRDAVERCSRELERAAAACEEGLSEEFPLYNLRKALDALGEITGEITSEDVMEEIFASFCIGK